MKLKMDSSELMARNIRISLDPHRSSHSQNVCMGPGKKTTNFMKIVNSCKLVDKARVASEQCFLQGSPVGDD